MITMERFVTDAGNENKEKPKNGTSIEITYLLNTVDDVHEINSSGDNCSVSFSIKNIVHEIWIEK